MLKNINKIFKAYDIRGIYPQELTEEISYQVGLAFVSFLKKSSGKSGKLKIGVGRDNRVSSPRLFKILAKGLTQVGANVVDFGLVTTPIFYFGVAYYKLDGGIQVTASHNPPQYNGFKLVGKGALPISEESGLKKIKNLIIKKNKKPSFVKTTAGKGKIKKKSVVPDYLKFTLKSVNLKNLKPLTIVIDTANAVPGILIPKIFQKTPFKIYHLFKKLDANFPNHEPNPQIEENLIFLKKEVIKKKADLGLAFDGDGDRVIFVDEKGKTIRADLITALMAEIVLRKNPKKKILYDLRSSNIIPEVIKKYGGRAIMGRVGHSFIKEKMRKENIFFAGEVSGHYYLRDNFFSESPFFVIFKILEQMSQTGKSISQIIQKYQKYYHSGEINFKTEGKDKIIKKLKKVYSKHGKITEIDGLRIDFKDWWFNVRASQTEPLLRLALESKAKDLLEKKKKELTSLITSNF